MTLTDISRACTQPNAQDHTGRLSCSCAVQLSPVSVHTCGPSSAMAACIPLLRAHHLHNQLPLMNICYFQFFFFKQCCNKHSCIYILTHLRAYQILYHKENVHIVKLFSIFYQFIFPLRSYNQIISPQPSNSPQLPPSFPSCPIGFPGALPLVLRGSVFLLLHSPVLFSCE